MTEKPHLSFSQINMFLRCPRQWEYRYVKGIKIPPGSALFQGKVWHETIENNYRQKIETREDLPLDHQLDYYVTTFDKKIKEEEVAWEEGQTPDKLKDEGVNITEVQHKVIAPTVFPVEVEKKFNLGLGDNFPFTLLGFWDCIDEDNIIIDNKSYGKTPNQDAVDKDLQLTAYATSYRLLNQKNENGLRLDCVIKTKTPKAVQLSTQRTKQECQWFLNLVETVGYAIKSGIFYPNPTGFMCSPKWCGYWNMCKEKI